MNRIYPRLELMMESSTQRRTIGRLMVKIALAAILIAPLSYIVRMGPSGRKEGAAILVACYGLIAFTAFIYRDFRNPFG